MKKPVGRQPLFTRLNVDRLRNLLTHGQLKAMADVDISVLERDIHSLLETVQFLRRARVHNHRKWVVASKRLARAEAEIEDLKTRRQTYDARVIPFPVLAKKTDEDDN